MSGSDFPTQLPRYDLPLIGRDLEAQDILERLRQPEVRWLPLGGSSGAAALAEALSAGTQTAIDAVIDEILGGPEAPLT
ncbi:MAG: hypothetical protein H0T53_06550 [Herpetosiphonaceae bacterium]|nr:hypothetical protein [Herpetosiphonaceae bacterium]